MSIRAEDFGHYHFDFFCYKHKYFVILYSINVHINYTKESEQVWYLKSTQPAVEWNKNKNSQFCAKIEPLFTIKSPILLFISV